MKLSHLIAPPSPKLDDSRIIKGVQCVAGSNCGLLLLTTASYQLPGKIENR